MSSSGVGGVLGAFSALFGLDRFDARKLKTNLKILSGRIKLLSEKRKVRIESIERDVEKLLKELEETTKGGGGGRKDDAEKTTMERALMARVESIENERNFLQILKHVDQFATEILETLCERSIEDVELTSSEAMRTSIASMLHAKSANKGRLTNELPELKAIANELGKKFGKAFALSCEREKTSEACGVSKRFIAAIAKCEKKKDERELRAMLERMAGFELPSFAKKTSSGSVKTKSKKKKKSALERRSDSSREASASGEEDEENSDLSDDNENPATTTIQKKKPSGRRKDKTTSKNQYASAETAAKAARDAANTAREAAEYAEALVATNEVLVAPKKTSPHSDTNDANNNNNNNNDKEEEEEEEEEEDIDSVVAAALDEARLEEERKRTGAASKKSPPRAFGGPPPGIASSQKPSSYSEVDDALAARFETLTKK